MGIHFIMNSHLCFFIERFLYTSNMRLSKSIYKTLLLLAIATTLPFCAVNPVSGKKELSFMSEEREIALGKQSDPAIIAGFGLYENPELQAFINAKGQEMAKISHRPNLNYEFKILDSPVVNAFAVPGGYVYFTRGIMAHFTNEAEFAGVLGHEIGHIAARHSARQQTKQTLFQLGFVLGVIVSKDLAEFAEPLAQSLGVLFLKFSRDDETESDRLGVEYSTKVGYDAHEMANFFNTLDKMRLQSGNVEIPTWQSTHPNPLNRYQNVNILADKWQADLNISNLKVNRDSYLKSIDGLIYGEDPRQGFVENDYFFHPELKFQFPVPRQWKTANSPQQFQMASQDGKALMVLTAGEGSSLQEAANTFNEAQKLTVISSRSSNVNNYPALTQLTEHKNGGSGETLKISSYFIQYEGLIYAFHGLTVLADFPQYESTFNYTMSRFDKLTDPNKLNRQPNRLSIVKAGINGTLDAALTYHKIPVAQREELAILNGMNLTDKVTVGLLIKIVNAN